MNLFCYNRIDDDDILSGLTTLNTNKNTKTREKEENTFWRYFKLSTFTQKKKNNNFE